MSGRADHVREQIAQILLTNPGERVFVKEFGIGAPQLLFLPMTPQMWSRVETTLTAGVSEALKGEAQQGSIQVSIGPAAGSPTTLEIVIRYQLVALNKDEELVFTVSDGALRAPGEEA